MEALEMEQGAADKPRNGVTREAFLARFTRVSPGLDPEQVYSLFQKATARIEQLETHARRSSAPFVIQATLREAAEICGKATEMAEHTYDEIVAAARREADRIRVDAERIRSEAQRKAQELERTSHEEAGRLREQARRDAQAIVAQTRREADELRKTADEYLKLAETTLEETRRYARDAASPEPPLSPAPNGSWPVAEHPQVVASMETHAVEVPAPTPFSPPSSPSPPRLSNGEVASLASALERLTPRVRTADQSPPPAQPGPPAPRDDRASQPGKFEIPGWLED